MKLTIVVTLLVVCPLIHSATISCAKGEFFDLNLKKCVPLYQQADSQIDAKRLCIDKDGKDFMGIKEFEDDCSKFVMCGPTGGIIMECNAGLLFNNLISSCDYPRDSHCCEYKGKEADKLVIPITDVKW